MILEELGIPGRSKDPVSTDPDVWGINIAAALGNFPCHGLQCQAGPWGNMAEGDRLTIFWGTGQNVWLEIVNKDEVKTQLRMFVPPQHMVDGKFSVSYSVKPLGASKDEPSEVMQVLVKLTRPGGHDDNGDGGHSKLIMIIPQDILDDGINKENLEAGVKISIGEANGTPPYPYAAAGDICRLSWGGIYVFSKPLTQEQAEGKTPIIITITEEIIKEAGDAPGVAVVFEVYDCVFNRSEDWSPEQRIKVAVDESRLVAPLLKGTVNNVLDVDELGDADGTVQVIATDTSTFKVGDEVFIRIKGTPVEGPPIDWEPSAGVELNSVPSIMEIKAPNAVLRQLAKSQITLSYRLEKADGSADLKSKSQFIRAIGEVQRLAAPEVLDENSGALDPTLPQIRLEIPFDKSFVEGQVLQPAMLGTTPGRKPYLPELPTRPITHNDIVAAKPLLYNIDGKHLTPVDGGTAEFYYQLLIPSAVLTTLDAFEASRAIRESIHSDILRVGEPRQELPQPKVAGVVDDVLPADTAGTTATVIYKETVNGDEIFMSWLGSITGQYPDSIKLNEFTAGKEVPFTIPAAMIKGNEGGTVEVKYEIKRAAGGTSYSDTLKFSVGVALDLTEPKIKQAPNDSSLDPLNAQTALTAVINYVGMLVGDKIIVKLIGAPDTLPGGSDITEPWPVSTVGPQEIPLAVSVLAFNLAKSITLSYTVTRGTQDPKDSRTRTLAVLPIAQSHLRKPLIVQASESGEGPELDVSQLTTHGTLRANSYPHIALKQYVWLKAKGTLKGGGDYSKTFWQPPTSQTNATWINQGFFAHNGFPLADLQSLEDGSDLELEFKAGFGGSQVETDAVTFALRTYRIRAYENVVPTLGSVKGSPSGDDIPHGGPTVETAVTLSGTGTPYSKIDLVNYGAPMPNTEIEVNPRGEWTFQLTGLVAGTTYNLRAKRKDGPVSNARNMVVVALVDPTLTSVKGSPSGDEIPQGQNTMETTVVLSGVAAKGQKVEIFDDEESKDQATAHTTSGAWALTVTGLTVGGHCFKARALYAPGAESAARTLTVSTKQYGAPGFINAPYTIAPAGQLKTIGLLLSTSSNTPIPGGYLSLTLPANFKYSDGGSSQRDFITDDVGRISVSGVKSTAAPGSYNLSATSGGQTTNSTVTVTGLGPVGSISTRTAPQGAVVSPDGTRIYIGYASGETISVIDTATNRILKDITTGSYPCEIALSPDGALAYVSNRSSHTVSVIDTATDRVLKNIQVETYPSEIAVSPDGTRAYVCHMMSGTISVIDTATDQVLTSIFTGGADDIAVSPVGTRAYVRNYGEHTVSVIDTATNRVLRNIPVGYNPNGVAVSPDGTRAYVLTDSETLLVFDTATDRILANTPLGKEPKTITLSPDGTRAYVSNKDNTVSVIDTATGRVLANIPIGYSPYKIAISPNGTRAYITCLSSNAFLVIEVSG
jgi:YVTN family beta-propeller protein